VSLVWIDLMAVDVRGDGDAIVFVHGLGGTGNVWTPLLPALSRWRCVRPDLPGAGRSHKAYALGESTPHRGKISATTHADALRRICESLGITRAHVVGHSFGTIIAQHLAADAPQLVRSLALFGALAEPPQGMRDNMVGRAPVAREQGMAGIAEGISDFALSTSTKQTQPVTVAFVRECVGAQDAEGFARNCEALATAKSARLELIRCPVLVVNGDEDQVTPLQGARHLAERLTQARVEVFSRCGHWPMLERAAESQRALRDFLQSVR
jgi:pimeloyl-ACP methyl ester carboxylesterase